MRPLLALLAASLLARVPALRKAGEAQAPALYASSAPESLEGACPSQPSGAPPVLNTATEQGPATQLYTNGSSAAPAFRNVLLVVHCRADCSICRAREWVFRQYAPYFGDVFYMTPYNHCPLGDGDPNVCLAELMETRGASRDGVLYTHFDALLSPANLALSFDKYAMGYFGHNTHCQLNRTFGFLTPACQDWQNGPDNLLRWQEAWSAMGHELIDDPFSFDWGCNDVFYIPRKAYAPFASMARGFARFGVFHEIAGNTIRIAIARRMPLVPNKPFGCAGGAMGRLTADDALSPMFKCGHKFDLADPATERVVPRVINGW